ncbi:ESCRT-0 subunit protein hse1 [Thoreauomyces humboldtii]|nr:ESCRT-0 subunit protein hse1 [Thoreauomyces humboldtii]
MSLEELITRATSETNTGEDWGLIIAICEKADRTEASAREAVQVLIRRVQHRNVNVVLFALTVANSLVHNCGNTLRREVASRAFVDALVRLVMNKAVHEVVRTRVLDFIQQWAEEFRSDTSLSFMTDTYNQLKTQGAQFPSPHKPDVVKTQAMVNKEKEDEELQMALALSLSAQETGTQSLKTSGSGENKPAPSPAHTGPKVLFQVRALYDFPGSEEGELRLNRNDVVNVYDATTFQDWWKGEYQNRIGIFPSNYVEKVAAATSSVATVYADASRASKDGEADVTASRARIEEFSQILKGIDPTRDSFAENERLQQTYSDILLLRPKLIKLLETYRAKQDELGAVSDRFTNACSTYHKLMEAQLAQLSAARQSGYGQQQHRGPQQGYSAPPQSYDQQGYPPQQQQYYAPPPQQQHQAAPPHGYPGYQPTQEAQGYSGQGY